MGVGTLVDRGSTASVRSKLALPTLPPQPRQASAEPETMTAETGGGSIESMLVENRVFPPSHEFARQAYVASLEQYQELWDRAKDDPEGFWGELARGLHWFRPWERVLDWDPPYAKWFVGGTLN